MHELKSLIAQRVFGLALGYEDLIDHDELRHDRVLGVPLGKLECKADEPRPFACKSKPNRFEHAPREGKINRHHKIGHDDVAIERLFVELFLVSWTKPPRKIVLGLGATDDPLHCDQEGRFFHGYDDCYCYLPLLGFVWPVFARSQAAECVHGCERKFARGDCTICRGLCGRVYGECRGGSSVPG